MRLITRLGLVNVRSEANHRSEIVTQLHYGEQVFTEIDYPEQLPEWIKIRCPDGYVGFAQSEAFYNNQGYIEFFKYNIKFNNKYRKVPMLGAEYSTFAFTKMVEPITVINPKIKKNKKINSKALITYAKSFLGVPYFWGGRSPLGFDCSGFIQYVFAYFGIELPRDAWQQAQMFDLVNTDKNFDLLEIGDLMFFGKESITHVALYIGNYEYIHASAFVRINSLNPDHLKFAEDRLNTFRFATRFPDFYYKKNE